MAKKKRRKCRICRKSPVWRGGDVRNPGPFCKKCYHKHIWPDRPGERRVRFVNEAYLDALCASLPEPPTEADWIGDEWLEMDADAHPDDDDWEYICSLSRGE